jgi:hypothetical protein
MAQKITSWWDPADETNEGRASLLKEAGRKANRQAACPLACISVKVRRRIRSLLLYF